MAVSAKEVFGNRFYLKLIVLLALLELGANLHYFGVNYAIDQIGYAYGTNMIASGLIECAGYFTLRTLSPSQS